MKALWAIDEQIEELKNCGKLNTLAHLSLESERVRLLRPCVCDYPEDGSATVAQREEMTGHYNEAGRVLLPPSR